MAVNVSTQLHYGGSWVNVPNMADPAGKISHGYATRGTRRPAQLAFRLNNDDDTMRPSNPSSPFYNAGRNMPAAMLIEGNIRAWMEAASFVPDQTNDFVDHGSSVYSGLRYVDLTANGVQRRIGQWTETPTAPLTRTFGGLSSLLGFWPCDDPSGATVLSNYINGASPGFAGITPGGSDAPSGASGSIAVTGGSGICTFPVERSSVAGFQVFFAFKLKANPAAESEAFLWRSDYAGGGNYWWKISVTATTIRLQVYDAGTLIAGSDNTVVWSTDGSVKPTNWTAVRVKVSVTAGTVKVEPAWYTQNGSVVWGTTITFTGVATTLDLVKLDCTVDSNLDGAEFCQIGACAGTADDLQSFAVLNSFNAWAGELAADRFVRVLAEKGITGIIDGDRTRTVVMGPQVPATLDQILDEIQASEDALIWDDVDGGTRVIMSTRRDRFNQAAKITLNYLTDIMAMPEVTDDQLSENDITVKNADGRLAASIDTTSSMSTAANPAGIGDYPKTYNTNLKNNQDITNAASWYRNRGTLPGSRYPTITIDLAAFPALQSSVVALRPGDRIVVTNRTADPLDLQLIGWDESIGVDEWTITLNCLPGDLFNVGSQDDTTYGLQTYANTVQSSLTTTGTSLAAGSPDPLDVWSTTNEPYDVIVAGERMTVTNATTATLSAGIWTQTLTVTRSVNGVVKAHSSTEPIRIFRPYREAW